MKQAHRFCWRSVVAAAGVVMVAGMRAGWGAETAGSPPPLTPAVTVPARALSDAFAAVAGRVRPAVVSVYSEKFVKFQSPEMPFPFGDDFFRQFFGERFHGQTPPSRQREYKVPQRGMGSGMILDKQGHILTNFHVVKDVDQIHVKLADDRQFEAEIVGTDPRSDVAVIRLKGKVPPDLPTVQLGDSDALRVGDLVMAVGAPFGLTQTATTGIISAKGRSDVGIGDFEDFLQTDAPINPGNSGGPLVNMNGQVIGMNTAIATSVGQFAGVGFAIPVNLIQSVLPALLKGQPITRGLLGVMIQEVTDELAKHFHLPNTQGALIARVDADTPAEKAGIKPGDVIIRYDGHDVPTTQQLRKLVAATRPGTTVKVVVLRDGKEQTVSATIARMPTETAAATTGTEPPETGSALTKLGLTLQTLTPDMAKQLGYDDNRHGVLITDVDEGSSSAEAGLQQGDLIVEADHQKVASLEDLQKVLEKTKDKDSVLLLINRKKASQFVVLPLK